MPRTIEIIEDLTSLKSLADEWNTLADQCKTPLLYHEWFTACAEAFCPPSRLSIRIVRANGCMTAVAPLVERSVFGMKRFELLGADILNEPVGFLYSDEESLAILLDSIMVSRTPILFNGLVSDSPEVRYLKDRHQSRYSISQSSSFASP